MADNEPQTTPDKAEEKTAAETTEEVSSEEQAKKAEEAEKKKEEAARRLERMTRTIEAEKNEAQNVPTGYVDLREDQKGFIALFDKDKDKAVTGTDVKMIFDVNGNGTFDATDLASLKEKISRDKSKGIILNKEQAAQLHGAIAELMRNDTFRDNFLATMEADFEKDPQFWMQLERDGREGARAFKAANPDVNIGRSELGLSDLNRDLKVTKEEFGQSLDYMGDVTKEELTGRDLDLNGDFKADKNDLKLFNEWTKDVDKKHGAVLDTMREKFKELGIAMDGTAHDGTGPGQTAAAKPPQEREAGAGR